MTALKMCHMELF